MTTFVKATYANGVFTPTEPVDLDEGAEVTLSMDDASRDSREAADGSGASLVQLIEELHASAPASKPDERPVDLAENYKYYLYGHPRDRNL